MSQFLEKLQEHGVDVKITMERFMNNEELYKKILKKFLQDTSFADAVKAKEEGNTADAEMYIHTLKGVSANLGLTPIYKITEKMMELFRSDNESGAYELFGELEDKQNEFIALIKIL